MRLDGFDPFFRVFYTLNLFRSVNSLLSQHDSFGPVYLSAGVDPKTGSFDSICVCFLYVQDGKTPLETLYSWQNGAKSLLCNFSQENPNQ